MSEERSKDQDVTTRITRYKTQGEGMSPPKPKRGRPVENDMPEPIPDTPENVALACMQGPPKKAREWRYMKKK